MLDGLADGFDDQTFIRFQPLSNDYSNEVQAKLQKLHKDDEAGTVEVFREAAKHAFKGGTVVVDGEHVEAEVDDLDDFGKVVLTDIFTTITQSKFVAPKA
ncbi:hypothetical protein [Curtobacterium sp. MCSS17_007]|uniref:hypothetical protein n=1 Tax=Curtobacterium sp. MCSS17_007 TaxID=2175646 RepID=UPI000DAA6D0E|nr:hypothetical protein [Curtobacterium sp. MCSS17_007]WIE74482.1 hypothetical protein DEJ22_009320 [Curtobacterium sp. MCSS17_007]